MIARIWKGRTALADADEYVEYTRPRCIEDYLSTPGNRGAYLLRRLGETEAEFVTISFWESFEAIRAFAGDDVQRARYYPEDERFLLELEPEVEHFEVVAKG